MCIRDRQGSAQRVQAAYARAIADFSVPESAVAYGRELGVVP